ncbi:MAG: hypothetical protein BGO30_10785 [Bacteroidetes bacterium 41-46]|nr:MAG: hypothetical protein BGO30_10785 [Bacteroidetes bacterium 41-46]
MIKGHGNDIYNSRYSVQLDFSSNIAFNCKNEEIFEHLKENINNISNYPDPEASELRKIIASHHNTSVKSILITNGSAEAFYIVAHYTANAHSAIQTPSFAEYRDACILHNHKITHISTHQITKANLSNFRTIWIGNPNNPDGSIIPTDIIITLCKENPKSLIVMDEAYIHLCKTEQVAKSPNVIPKNLIIIRSLTKAFAIPGLRLGYIVASPDIISKIRQMRPPWSVNSIALIAGKYIMDRYEKLLPDINQLCSESQALQEAISKISGFEVTTSDCNFFLIKSTRIDARLLKSILLKKYGILIRNASNFKGLTKYHFRVATQSREENNRLIKALQDLSTNF